MIRVLFVCHGNICRSAMAEYIFNDYVSRKGLDKEYISFSRAVSREEIGNDIYPPARRCLEKHGIPYGRHYADQISRADYTSSDHIFLMDSSNAWYFRSLMNDDRGIVEMLLSERDIADPWYTGDFEKTYNDIVEGIERFFERENRGK